jgi:hypothetical protein
MNTIPGADVLGFGFNILGEYDTSSITSQLFIHANPNFSQYTFPGTQVTFEVPDNVSVIPDTEVTGSTQVFSTRKQFQSYFSAKAGLSGSYNAFSGQFNAAYSQTFNSSNSYYYGLTEANFKGWDLSLNDQSSNWISTGFKNNPAVQALPSTFTADNKQLFFDMFRQFGTHYISQVTVGGSLYYYVAVDQSFSSNQNQVDINLSLEYKAVFSSAKADAKSEWKQLTESWANSRIVKVDATGGDTSVLSALNPSYGDNDSDIFKSWSTAVMQNPAVILFQLRPLSKLFSGNQADAVSDALQAYTNGAILVNANADYTKGYGPDGGDYTTSSSIIINGTVSIPNPSVPAPEPTVYYASSTEKYIVPISGFQIALFDAVTLETIFNHIYYLDSTSLLTEGQVYTEIMKDINGVQQKDYLCTVAAFAVDLMAYPSNDFANWLSSCGAQLAGWKSYIGFCGDPGMVSYVCIGKQGLMPGNATENFACTTLWIDEGQPLGSINASAQVFLYADEITSKVLTNGKPKGFGSLMIA